MKFEVQKHYNGWIVRNTRKFPNGFWLTKIYNGVPEFQCDYIHAKAYTTEKKAREIATWLSTLKIDNRGRVKA